MNWSASQFARLFEVAGLNLLLSGDNLVVVGIVIRDLTPGRRKAAAMVGVPAAITLQIVAALTVAQLLGLTLVSLAAAVLLVAIAIRMARSNTAPPQMLTKAASSGNLAASTAFVVTGYLAMSVDNILAVAALGRGHLPVLAAGMLLSCVIIVPASVAVAGLMRRYRVILLIGAGIVGWVAGSIAAAAIAQYRHTARGHMAIPVLAVLIVLIFWWRQWRREKVSAQDPS